MPDERPDDVPPVLLTVGRLETARLLLRPFQIADLDDLHAVQGDPEVVRYLPWPVRTREQSRTWLQARIDAPDLRADDDAVAYAVERRHDRRVIGSITLFLRSVEHRQGEVGFAFERPAQGQGYAFEASQAVVDLAFLRLGLHRITGCTDSRNEPSARLLRRLGMRQEAHFRENELFEGQWRDLLVFAQLREEWASLRDPGSGR